MHLLLDEHLKRQFPDGVPPELRTIFEIIESDYAKADFDRELADRELDLVSRELTARDEELRSRAARLPQLQHALARTARATSFDPAALAASLRPATEAP